MIHNLKERLTTAEGSSKSNAKPDNFHLIGTRPDPEELKRLVNALQGQLEGLMDENVDLRQLAASNLILQDQSDQAKSRMDGLDAHVVNLHLLSLILEYAWLILWYVCCCS